MPFLVLDDNFQNIPKVFQAKAQSKKEERLERENRRLQTMVGKMAMELKKNDCQSVESAPHRDYRRIRPICSADYPAAQKR